MKREQKNKTIGGIRKNIEKIETTPEDGLIQESIIKPTNVNTYGNYHKGYAKTKVYSTNDPRITRSFVYGMCILFFSIGILLFLFKMWFFAIIFIGTAVFVFVKTKKDIDTIAKNLKKQGHDVTIDSVEEKEQIKQEVIGALKDDLKDVTSKTFTKDKYNWFIKTTIPIYSVIVSIIVIIVSIFINIFVGIILLILLVICAIIYYYIISRIFKEVKK